MSNAAVARFEPVIEFSQSVGAQAAAGSLSIVSLLGGERTMGKAARLREAAGFDAYYWHHLISENGMKVSAVKSFQANCFPNAATSFYKMVGMSERTAQRRMSETPKAATVDAKVAESVVVLARLIKRSVDVLGSTAKAQQWWMRNNQALDDVAPIKLIGSRFGVEAVEDTLNAIEHGFFS